MSLLAYHFGTETHRQPSTKLQRSFREALVPGISYVLNKLRDVIAKVVIYKRVCHHS